MTCHHVIMPKYLHYSSKPEWDKYGIQPVQATHLGVDMPGKMDHIETINEFKSDLQELDSKAHREIARKLADPNDAVIPYERQRFGRAKKTIDDMREKNKPSTGIF